MRGRGLGLGLAIVRRLCALLDHRARRRVGTGRGLAILGDRRRARRDGRRRVDAASPRPRHGRRPSIRSAFAGRSVVVVDDDPAVVVAMEALFTSWGARVAGGDDARRACSARNRAPGPT